MKKQALIFWAASVFVLMLTCFHATPSAQAQELSSVPHEERAIDWLDRIPLTLIFDVATDARSFRLNRGAQLPEAKRGDSFIVEGKIYPGGTIAAGGTLAAVCAVLARDAGLPLALQLLFYPGCGGHQDTPSHRTFAHGFVLEAPHIDYFFNHYLRTPADRNDWRFAPLDGCDDLGHQPDLEGVAPAWFGLAECDPLIDEGVLYADKLRAAGVHVDLEIYRGVVHEFIKMGRALPEAAQAHADAARALRHAFLTEASQ